MKGSAIIIGSGFSSLSTACYLAKAGYKVTVYEKNESLGGRARQFVKNDLKFDMGPTWYWMPDVFERFFSDFNKKTSDYYILKKLSPGYKVYFGENDFIEISDSFNDIVKTFESIEKGSGKKLTKFIHDSGENYKVAIQKLVYKPGISFLELITKETVLKIAQFFQTIHSHVSRKFKNTKLKQILEFPVLFLGAKPQDTPLFYNFMNYADFKLGTWYPEGGMYSVANGIVELAKELGVKFKTNSNIDRIIVIDKVAKGIVINGEKHFADLIISGADYHHTEKLLDKQYRNYNEKYWSKKTMAPSALLFYVGFDKKLTNLRHHTLFFDESFDKHAVEIYDNPKWPKNPLFYASFPSITDKTIAPEDKEAGIFLIPLATDLEDNQQIREKYFDILVERVEKLTNQKIKEHILFKESYCVNDFKKDYNSYKGNAYGMANTLFQTAFLRPKIKNKKVKNLYYTGQLTVPGPGVPPALISGKLVSDLIINNQ